VIGEFHRRHRAIEFRRCLETIDAAVPVGPELHLILDNYGTHKTPAIKRWLLRHPRFHLHFTPTGASWLNLVERLFALLTEKQLRRGVHRSTRELEDAIRAYLDHHNRNPKPFIWTKTADQILESVTRFCKRISDSGH
jgi:transposase